MNKLTVLKHLLLLFYRPPWGIELLLWLLFCAQKVIAVYLPVLWMELHFTAILELVEMIASLPKIDELYYRIK